RPRWQWQRRDIDEHGGSVFCRAKCTFQNRLQLLYFLDRPEDLQTIRTRQFDVIDARVLNRHSDVFVLNRSAPTFGDDFLMLDVVVERLVIVDDEKARQLFRRRRPQCLAAHEQVAITQYGDGETSGSPQCKRRPNGNSRSRAYAATAIHADAIE